MTKPAILVFAYHDVGYECLDALIQNDEYILAVITHKDDPEEEIWFRSVAELARKYDIPVHTPESVNTPDWIERIRSWAPDLIFSFYYRNMIREEILNDPAPRRLQHARFAPPEVPRPRADQLGHTARRKRDRGDAPSHGQSAPTPAISWTRRRCPSVPMTRRRRCSTSASTAARLVLERQIEALTTGTAPRRAQDESQATYFGGRKPEDGRIDWTQSAENIYNLIRAVTQPYPGAFTQVDGKKLFIWWARPLKESGGTPGQVISVDPLIIATGAGNLEIVNYEWEDEDERELKAGQVLGT